MSLHGTVSRKAVICRENSSSSLAALLAVGEARRVADVGEVLRRQLHQALVEHGEATHAAVEHADGQGGELLRVV